jgi:enoyl-CoA hydratase
VSAYETILVEQRGCMGWITLNRPSVLNALNTLLMHEVVAATAATVQFSSAVDTVWAAAPAGRPNSGSARASGGRRFQASAGGRVARLDGDVRAESAKSVRLPIAAVMRA